MTHEQQRRAYLDAMQVTTWLPRVALPFAAPSDQALLDTAAIEPPTKAIPMSVTPVRAPETTQVPSAPVVPKTAAARPAPVAELKKQITTAETEPVAAVQPAAEIVKKSAKHAVPRFALQLLRAGNCLVLLETPTGFALQTRDPAYLLLKDMLRAAGLTDRPLLVGDGEPIRWPLFKNSRVDQGPQAARDYVQGVLMAEMLREPCVCIWLVGLPALRYGAGLEADAYNNTQAIEGLGLVWALPGLELLMDEPMRKAPLWQAMRTLIPRWNTV